MAEQSPSTDDLITDMEIVDDLVTDMEIVDDLVTDMEIDSPLPMIESGRRISISNATPQRTSLINFSNSDEDDNNESELPLVKPKKNEFNQFLQSIQQINSKSFDPKQAFTMNFINNLYKFLVDPNGNTDFKLIGISLDAAVKLYASKVATVLCQTQMFSSRLVMATNNQQVEIDDIGEEFLEDYDNNRKKKKKVNKRNNIIASVDQLHGKFDTNIEIDPIFHKLSEAFYVGNVSSLLMANLKTDPNGVMLLDSMASLNFENNEPVKPCPLVIEDIEEMNEFKKIYDSIGTSNVCPAFTNFEFNSRDTELNKSINLDSLNYQIDIDGDVEEIDINENDNIDDFFNADFHVADEDNEENSNFCPVDHHNLEDGQKASEDHTRKVLTLLPHNDNHLFNKVYLRKFLKKRRSFIRHQPNRFKLKRQVKNCPENVYYLFEDVFDEEDSTINERLATKWYIKLKKENLPTDYGFEPSQMRECGQNSDINFLDVYQKISGGNLDQKYMTITSDDGHDDDGVMNEESFDINQDELGFDSASPSGNHIDDEYEEALDVDYAKVSKKIDIKRIKRGMWEIIEQESTVTVPMVTII